MTFAIDASARARWYEEPATVDWHDHGVRLGRRVPLGAVTDVYTEDAHARELAAWANAHAPHVRVISSTISRLFERLGEVTLAASRSWVNPGVEQIRSAIEEGEEDDSARLGSARNMGGLLGPMRF